MPYSYKMVTRDEWGALPPTGESETLPSPLLKVIMTKTKTPACFTDEECKAQMRQLQKFHMNKGLEDIPYSFIVTPNSMIYEGRGWFKSVPTPPERPEFKHKAIVIGHVGDFPEYDPRYRQIIRDTMDLIDFGIMNDKLIDFDFHLADMYPYIKNDDFLLEGKTDPQEQK